MHGSSSSIARHNSTLSLIYIFCLLCFLVSFLSTWHKLLPFVKAMSQLRQYSHHTVLWENFCSIFFINDWFGTTPRAVLPPLAIWSSGCLVLDYIRKQAEQSMREKPLSNISSWYLLQFLPPGHSPVFLAGLWCGTVNSSKVIFPQVPSDHGDLSQ